MSERARERERVSERVSERASERVDLEQEALRRGATHHREAASVLAQAAMAQGGEGVEHGLERLDARLRGSQQAIIAGRADAE